MTYTDLTDRSPGKQVQIYQVNIQTSLYPNTYCETSIFFVCTYIFAMQLCDFPQFLSPTSQTVDFPTSCMGCLCKRRAVVPYWCRPMDISQQRMVFSNTSMKVKLCSPLSALLFPKCIWDTGPYLGLVLSFGAPWLLSSVTLASASHADGCEYRGVLNLTQVLWILLFCDILSLSPQKKRGTAVKVRNYPLHICRCYKSFFRRSSPLLSFPQVLEFFNFCAFLFCTWCSHPSRTANLSLGFREKKLQKYFTEPLRGLA